MTHALALVRSEHPPASPVVLVEDAYTALVDRLSRASVKKHFDAYRDVPWDEPASRIDPEDPRWTLSPEDPLGSTEYYRGLTEPERARLGLATTSFQMKMGIAFESVLQRGLLELAGTLPNGSPEYRYAYHEVIEEGQHSLMFQEFVNRSGFDAPGMSPYMAWAARRVPPLGRKFPELFFLHVLGGEAPIDHVQRLELRRGDSVHPLKRRIMQIHVTEEARHVCFAERYLERHVPELSAFSMLELRVVAPFVVQQTARLMLSPPPAFFARTGLPRSAAREAFGGPAYRKLLSDGTRPIRELCVRLGIVTPAFVPVWRALGVWAPEGTEYALPS
ncbi:MAG TPA: diiron oxygenase [Polyangiaceae bacterium]|nr:diiron oxygenase [Polyangiaceae bacterium]